MRLKRTIGVFCLLLAFLTPAFAWPPATHGYLANRLKRGGDTANVMFGAMTPDINQVVSTDQNSAYFFATHYPPMEGFTEQGFLDLWNTGQLLNTPTARSLAFGFATHNEEWGADYYAHIKSRLYPRYTNPQYPGQNGYVWVKAGQLCRLMKAQLGAVNIDDPMLNELLGDTMNCHFIVEYAMDLLLKATRDPLIGSKVLAAAQTHDAATMQSLFVGTYTQLANPLGETPGAVTMGMIMAGAEPMWSQVLTHYGTALSLPMNQAIPAVAAFLETLGEAQVFGGPLPPDKKQLVTIVIELGLLDSLALCAFDLNTELELTVYSVRNHLVENGVKF